MRSMHSEDLIVLDNTGSSYVTVFEGDYLKIWWCTDVINLFGGMEMPRTIQKMG